MSKTKSIQQAISQGRFEHALAQIESAQQDNAGQPLSTELGYLKTVALRLSKQVDAALNLALEVAQRDPQHARIYQEMGHLYLLKQDKQQAAIAFYQASKRNPALLASWKMLHTLYTEMQNLPAQNIAKAQIDYLQGLPKEIMGARDLMYEGQLHSADQVCRRYLQTQPHDKEGLLLLAEIGVNLKVYGEAEFILETCLELYPDFVPAGTAYLQLLAKMGKFQAALTVADSMLSKQPDNKQLITAKASALVGVGQVEQAISIYQQLLSAQQDQPAIHLLHGHALKAAGQFEQAISAYQAAYQCKADFGDAYWSLANTKTYRFSQTEITQMTQLLDDPNMATDDRVHLLFALGKACEDNADYATSFDFYAQGNSLKCAQLGYQPEHFEQQVAAQKRICSKAFFERYSGAGDTRDDPIFIVGLPRSGSTLLEQILASHSQVDGTMELHNVLGLVTKLRTAEHRYPDSLPQIEKHYFARFGAQYLQQTEVFRAGANYFIDKMPNNFLHIGLIKLMLPNAKIIDARRHPMACCFSGFKQLFGDGQEFTYGLENIGRYYRAYLDMMQHWDEVLPGFVLRVQHEQVIDDLEGQVRRILAFCNLPFEQSCIDFHQTKRTIKTPSSEQVRQPIYRSGMQQWKHFEAHLGPLKTLLGEAQH